MSRYTTGEIAKLCGVSVRTVQYYDTRGILIPSELSEGGRRLYTEDDVDRMKLICWLREMGLPIHTIGELLCEETSAEVITMLLDQHEALLRAELQEQQRKAELLADLRRGLRTCGDVSVKSMGDVARMMKNKKQLKKFRVWMVIIGLLAVFIEYGTALLWIFTGVWWPFAMGLPVAIALCVWMSAAYYRCVRYLCPKCHAEFKPRFRTFLFSAHTPNTRKLTCSHCGHKGYCVETYDTEVSE